MYREKILNSGLINVLKKDSLKTIFLFFIYFKYGGNSMNANELSIKEVYPNSGKTLNYDIRNLLQTLNNKNTKMIFYNIEYDINLDHMKKFLNKGEEK